MAPLLLVGTKKGLFLVGDGGVDELLLPGWSVFHAVRDGRDGALFAAANHFVYGATVQRSEDGGKTWERSGPAEGLARAWHVEPARAEEPATVWLGGDPAQVYRSDDGGRTWQRNEGIAAHPTRERWTPGMGGLTCHSFQVAADGTLYAGISAAGAFRSGDGGSTWTPINAGVAADFLPDPYPDVGQCVHKLLVHPARPERLWQQNHCGVYRSDDRGDTWERLDGNGLPSSFGFGIALDPGDPDVAYVIPEVGSENRVVSDGRLGVYRTADGGASWELWADGLPMEAWTGVLREAMSFDADGVYFGTQSGSVYASDGGRWRELAHQLPQVQSVEAAGR